MAAVHRIDAEASRRAMKRWQQGRRQSRVMFSSAAGNEEAPRVREWTTRLWLQRPDRMREETTDEHPRYGVRVGETWWMYSEGSGALTNEGDPHHNAGIGQELQALLEPSPLIPHFDFEVEGETEHVGRRSLHALGRQRELPDSHHLFFPGLTPGTNCIDLLVDVERGVLLRLVSLLDDEAISTIEVQEIAFDEPLDPDLFVFVPPEGEELQRTSDRHAMRDLSLEEVAQQASFPVFAASGLDAGWRLRALHLKPDRRQRTEQVHLRYSRDDATHSFGINEQPAQDPAFFATVREPERVERDGRELFVVRPHDDSPLAAVRLTREGTAMELISDNLDADALLEIAARLKRWE
ncbi:MAG: LolA family protein [Gaiellaceae bacterium]